ncbi:hypothetical protein [Metabacillus endolithicus]|uniref:Uncharacterized protein n=2 Tax=Metabacillus endolithicus TaxID=1535204 RepID=A0ABW5C278_9BACI
MFFPILFTLILLFLPIFQKKRIDPANGALIMATGIFCIGFTSRFTNFSQIPLYTADIALLIAWFSLFFSFIKTVFKGTFRRRYITHPVQSFAIGTWIAGTSILCLLFYKQFPEYKFVYITISLLSGGLWLFYLFICIQCYYVILKSKYFDKIHGVLFLSTVSTQSLVIVYGRLFNNHFFYELTKLLIFIGIILYIINFSFILKRYIFYTWNLSDHWLNTNCIIHGAISISGIAAISSGTINNTIIFYIWLLALTMFFLVEGIEISRMFSRLSKYSFQKAIGCYHVSQWARNFTFGTLYLFTINLELPQKHVEFYLLKTAIINIGLYILILLLVIEAFIFLMHVLNRSQIHQSITPILRGYIKPTTHDKSPL